MVRSIWALGLVLFLAACGGGGGGGSSSPTTMPPVEPPTPPRDIRAEVSAIYAEADTILMSDVPITFQGNYLLGDTVCSGRRCETYEPVTGLALESDLALGLSPTSSYGQVSERRSVSLANFTDQWVWYDAPINVRGYGGWMEFNAFDVGVAHVGSGPLAGAQGAAATSVGNNTGSRPTGSATWHGVMIGGTDINNRPEALQGDATVQYEMARNVVDVSFTNIRNIDAGQQFHNMGWSDVPVGSDGSFGRSGVSDEIEGTFYGPNHAEVGGVFIERTAVGSFGAKR